MGFKHKDGYHAGEVVLITPVEWVTERKGFITEISTTYLTDQENIIKITEQVRPRSEHGSDVLGKLFEHLTHRELHYPKE